MPCVEEEEKTSSKDYWITYKLQSLSTEKFLKVVQKILDGEHILLKPPEIDIGKAEKWER